MPDGKIDVDKYKTIRSLSSGRKSRTRKYTVENDTSGSFQTEHYDGRLDATIVAKPIVAKLRKEK